MDVSIREPVDVLVIGAGLTGLRAAVAASGLGKRTAVLSKGPRCSTGVIGFNAPVGPRDSPDRYFADLQASGQGLSRPSLARTLARRAAGEAAFLESMGMEFSRDESGGYDLLKPLGCSVPCLIHKGIVTGAEAERLFLEALRQAHVPVRFDVDVLDLLSDGGRVYGAVGVEGDGTLCCYPAGAVVLAAGGCGALYPVTTYPAPIRGDSYAMAARAGAVLTDMEFIQFEPCCLTEPGPLRGKGISTTMMNAGGRLLNGDGKEFLSDYFQDLNGVKKGELARAIYAEKRRCGGRDVLYDLTGLSAEELERHCLWTERLRSYGWDPLQRLLPIAPAAHTFLGGVRTDSACRTSVEGLFAAGEAMGGLHGADRLGGCAGAETFVFGAVAGESAARFSSLDERRIQTAASLAGELLDRLSAGSGSPWAEAESALLELRRCAGEDMSLVRSAAGIGRAKSVSVRALALSGGLRCRGAEELRRKNALRSMALTLGMMAAASEVRRESRGVFYREDLPQTDAGCAINIRVTYHGGEIAAGYGPAGGEEV